MRLLGLETGQVANVFLGQCALTPVIGGAIGGGSGVEAVLEGVSLGAALGGTAGALFALPTAGIEGFVGAIAGSLLSGALPIVGADCPALGFREIV